MEGQEDAKAAKDLCSDLPGVSFVHPQLSPGDSRAPAPSSAETHTESNEKVGRQSHTKSQCVARHRLVLCSPLPQELPGLGFELFITQ